jgi:hypothetical protein
VAWEPDHNVAPDTTRAPTGSPTANPHLAVMLPVPPDLSNEARRKGTIQTMRPCQCGNNDGPGVALVIPPKIFTQAEWETTYAPSTPVAVTR